MAAAGVENGHAPAAAEVGLPDEDAPPPPPPPIKWDIPRQELVQVLWGAGFSVPGEPDYVLELVKPFGLTNANTMLEFGAGLGGGARVIASKIGCYVDAFDLNAELVAHAKELAISADIDNKAIFRQYAPDALKLKQKFYDAGLIRETFLQIEEKAPFVETIAASLKPNTSLVINDFFLPAAEPGELAQEALGAEGIERFPCGTDEIVEVLEEYGFEIRINADETERYVALAKSAWNDVAAKLAQGAQDAHTSAAVMREIDLWTKRNAAFDKGELQMRRIVCFKKTQIV